MDAVAVFELLSKLPQYIDVTRSDESSLIGRELANLYGGPSIQLVNRQASRFGTGTRPKEAELAILIPASSTEAYVSSIVSPRDYEKLIALAQTQACV